MQGMDPQDVALWMYQPAPWLQALHRCAEVNAQFLALLPSTEVCGVDLGEEGDAVVARIPEGHRVQSRNSSKVQSTLRQFVRDWSREGASERMSSYGPLINALRRHLPVKPGQRAPKVLCPGCGLGRLPYDLAAMGYAAQGNEFSYHMLLGSHMMLNRCTQVEGFEIFPFATSTTNRRVASDHLRPIRIPDVCPRMSLSPHAQLSMSAGEFIQIYGDQPGRWDAVASAFFLDTAKNIFLYIRVIASILRQGGLLINLGPLLYHYAHQPEDISIEISWEELRPFLCKYFDIVEEETREARYTTIPGSLSGVRYRCKFFVAVRNAEPVTGRSNPVF
jgi:SAM-dependent methyltransferase